MGGPSRLSRRSVLSWGGVLGVTLTVPMTASAAATTSPGGARLGPPTRIRLLTPGGAGDRDVPRSLAVVVDDPLPVGARVELSYDPDLYALLPRPLVHSGDEDVEVDYDAPTPGRVLVTLRRATTSPTTVIAGGLVPARYPHDIRRDVRGTEVGGGAPRRRLDRAASTAGEPWGAEGGVLWEAVEWGDGYRYFVPVSASFVAVGPGPVPAGCRLTVRADARVLTRASVVRSVDAAGRPVRGTFSSGSGGGVTELTWRAAAPVPAGDRVVLELRTSVTTPRGPLPDVSLPVIDIVAPGAGAAMQRQTRLTSLTRRDVVCDDAALRALRPA